MTDMQAEILFVPTAMMVVALCARVVFWAINEIYTQLWEWNVFWLFRKRDR